MKKMYEWYIYKEKKKKKKQLRVILFVRFRIPHVSIQITLTSLTFKPSFVRGLNNPHIGLRPYLEKLKIRVETPYTLVALYISLPWLDINKTISNNDFYQSIYIANWVRNKYLPGNKLFRSLNPGSLLYDKEGYLPSPYPRYNWTSELFNGMNIESNLQMIANIELIPFIFDTK